MPENEMLEDAEFENQITALGDDQLGLIKFNARQTFKASKVLVDHGSRIKNLERQNKKVFGAVGGAGAILATAIAAFIDYLMRRG
ncbi:hypothetical protein LCGC14_2157660 [marine sediment metagenome]|uniref:Uncharacterized protein n=1 Tax=marine sediment metagenome TaxID=412755 RepID=A0A0F9G6M2_9ZZZZ